eukprot:TRINITY_DN74504_c0_g1_i1.p1 TRINITY_DN74504_c0_g1~~TRINITY_DN74504_c0_g1_i1.p1  ORF type:complete len:104 (+),score=4.60 TRINITY_DN74504_c0_g1_i1:75-386(+)
MFWLMSRERNQLNTHYINTLNNKRINSTDMTPDPPTHGDMNFLQRNAINRHMLLGTWNIACVKGHSCQFCLGTFQFASKLKYFGQFRYILEFHFGKIEKIIYT